MRYCALIRSKSLVLLPNIYDRATFAQSIQTRQLPLLSISVFSVVYFNKGVENWCAPQQIRVFWSKLNRTFTLTVLDVAPGAIPLAVRVKISVPT
jgi:hypothetical protein